MLPSRQGASWSPQCAESGCPDWPVAMTAWKDLMWTPEDGVRYHYSITRTSKTTLVLRAEGDPACEGKAEAWEVTATVQGAEMKVDKPHLAAK